MTTIRPAAVAGSFYPVDARQLALMIDAMIGSVEVALDEAPPPAIIVPHAGYVYSGPIAATAYAKLVQWRGTINRVVVIGPAHRVAVGGLALSSADEFVTPLGAIPMDGPANRMLLRQPGVYVNDRAHAMEHSVEVHLPFLQRTLGDEWSLVPVVAGSADATTVADALALFWGEPGTLVVVSTDLSHFYDSRAAHKLDTATAAAIVADKWEALTGHDACGAVPLRGALLLARRHGEQVQLLDLRNSADTAGPADRVVGYGSFVVR